MPTTRHVDDDGNALADRRRIFERFGRTDEARARPYGGTGLGLAIVAELTSHYDGEIRVDDSTTLGGARFTVTLPNARHYPETPRVRLDQTPVRVGGET